MSDARKLVPTPAFAPSIGPNTATLTANTCGNGVVDHAPRNVLRYPLIMGNNGNDCDERDVRDAGDGDDGNIACWRCKTKRLHYANGDTTEIRDRPDRENVIRKLCRVCGFTETVEAHIARKRLQGAGKAGQGGGKDVPDVQNAPARPGASNKRRGPSHNVTLPELTKGDHIFLHGLSVVWEGDKRDE